MSKHTAPDADLARMVDEMFKLDLSDFSPAPGGQRDFREFPRGEFAPQAGVGPREVVA